MSASNGKGDPIRARTQRDPISSKGALEPLNVGKPVRGVRLRQVTEDDMPFLFRIFSDPARCHLWMCGRRVYDEREFHEAWIGWTSQMMGAKFLVESCGQPIGLVFEYDRNLEDGHAKITALLEEENVGHGAGAIAIALLLGWLFQNLPLRKVYFQVYGYNPRVVRMCRKMRFSEEGALRENRFWKGSWWDLHVFSVYREAWPEVRRRVLGRSRASHRRLTRDADASAHDTISARRDDEIGDSEVSVVKTQANPDRRRSGPVSP